MRNRNGVMLLTATLVVTLGLVGCGSKNSDTAGPVVAKYNGGEIHDGEFQKQYKLQRTLVSPNDADSADQKKQFLEDYILDQKIIFGKAKAAGVKVDDNQVKTSVTQYKSQLVQYVYGGDNNKLNDQMKKLGITDKDLTGLVQTFLSLQQFQQDKLKDVKVSDDELKKYYDEHKDEFSNATVWHILTKTPEEAKAAKDRVVKGEDFAKVAKEVSIDPSAKDNGGKMEGPLTNYVDPFREAAAKLPIGQLSDPVKSEFGYHIIKVEKRDAPDPFDKVKATLQQKLFSEKSQKFWDDFREEQKKNANIQITLPAEKK